MPDDLNTVLNEALPRWATLTGTKLGASAFSFTIGSSSEFQSLDLKKYVDDLNAARSLDMSGTTATLLLRGLFAAYVEEQAFKVHALLYAPAKVETRLGDLRGFHELILTVLLHGGRRGLQGGAPRRRRPLRVRSR